MHSGNYTWRAWPNHQVENRLPTGPFAVVVGDKLVTGGGVDLYPNYPVFAENVHYFDLNTREWTKGGNLSVPCPVFGSVAVHNNTITLLSGYEMEYYYLVCRNRISEYDLLTHKFKQTGLRNDLPPLCSSSNIVVDNKLFMFGGDWIESTTTNSTNSTNITSLIAYDLVTKEFILNFSFAGDIPTNRIHSAIFRSPKPHKFRIFGGIEKDPSDGYWHYCSTSDIYEFDVGKHTHTLSLSIQEYAKSCYPYECTHTETHVWTKIAQKQTRPQRVYLSSSQELPQDSAGHVLLTGGYRYSSSSNQTWKYDPSSNTWTRLNDLPIEREGPALVSWKDKLIVVGGYSNENINSILAVYTEGPLSAPPPPSGKMVVDECAFQLWWDNPSDIRFMENYITYDINITRLSDGESQISQMAFSYYPQVRVNSSSLLISGQTYLASVRITPTAITSSPWSQEFEIQIPPNKSECPTHSMSTLSLQSFIFNLVPSHPSSSACFFVSRSKTRRVGDP